MCGTHHFLVISVGKLKLGEKVEDKMSNNPPYLVTAICSLNQILVAKSIYDSERDMLPRSLVVAISFR